MAPQGAVPGDGTGVVGVGASSVPATFDARRVRAAVRQLLVAIGEDPDRDGLAGTPDRVARGLAEIVGGLAIDPAAVLDVTFTEDYDELVMVRDIPVYSLCEHHLLPWFGRAHVGYIPNRQGTITGLSKLARLVDGYARRPQVQERFTRQIADALDTALTPRGVITVVEAEHLCMSMRGVRVPGATTVTSQVRGLFRADAATRAEALNLLRGRPA